MSSTPLILRQKKTNKEISNQIQRATIKIFISVPLQIQ